MGNNIDLAEIERDRLKALVEADLPTVELLHAEEFQLITPGGEKLSRVDYLGRIESGEINYLRWEPETIDVRIATGSGCVRYRSTIEGIFDGVRLEPGRYWHTDYYEVSDGRWRVVWSQATATSD